MVVALVTSKVSLEELGVNGSTVHARPYRSRTEIHVTYDESTATREINSALPPLHAMCKNVQ